MGDELNQGAIGSTSPAGQPAGENVPAAQPQTTLPTGEATGYITEADARRMVDAAVKASLGRVQQGITDRVSDRLSKAVTNRLTEIEATVQQLKASGVSVSPETVQQAKDQAMKEALMGAPAGTGQQPQGQAPDWVWGEVSVIGQDYGVVIEENDPEAKMIVFDRGPRQFLRTYEDAAKAKRDRTHGQQQPTQEQSSQAVLRSPALGGGAGVANPIGSINNPLELIKRGLSG